MSNPEIDRQQGGGRIKKTFKWIAIATFYIAVFGSISWFLAWAFIKMGRSILNFHPHPLPIDHELDGLFWGLVGVYIAILALVVGFVVAVLEKNKVALLIVLGWALVAIAVPLLLLLVPVHGQTGLECGSFVNPKDKALQCFSTLSLTAKWAFGIAAFGVVIPIAWLGTLVTTGQASSKEDLGGEPASHT